MATYDDHCSSALYNRRMYPPLEGIPQLMSSHLYSLAEDYYGLRAPSTIVQSDDLLPTLPKYPQQRTGYMYGWRLWRTSHRDDSLYSLAFDCVWPVGTVEGVHLTYEPTLRNSRPRPCHLPFRGCVCGIHAFYSFDDAISEVGGSILGIVRAWGKIAFHQRGFRAQYVQPLLLVSDYEKIHLGQRYGCDTLVSNQFNHQSVALLKYLGPNGLVNPQPWKDLV